MCLQETKLLANENGALKSVLFTHTLFYSNNPANTGSNASTYTAGVCTALSNTLCSKFVVSTVPLHSSLSGHALALLLCLPGTDFSLLLLNIRLLTPPGDKTTVQEEQVRRLRKSLSHLHPKYTIMTGDFNFVDRHQDTSSTYTHTSRPQWDKLIHKFSLWDVICDSHSFFHRPEGTNIGWSSRLDRFYISHSEADLAIVRPISSCDNKPLLDAGCKGFNAHLPTSLLFFPRVREHKGARRIADHIIDHDKFVPFTVKKWNTLLRKNPSANPISRLSLLSSAIHQAAKAISNLKDRTTPGVVIFQKAIALYRLVTSINPADSDILRLADGTPLLSLLHRTDIGWDSTFLVEFINSAFRSHGSPELDGNVEDDVSPHPDPPDISTTTNVTPKANVLKELKLTLPSSRTKISALRTSTSSPPSSSPSVIGPIISSHYSKIWSPMVQGLERSPFLNSYLDDYDRTIDSSLITAPSLDLVLQAIHLAPSSSPGPDGIPFRAYKKLTDLAAQVILDVCTYLGVRRSSEQLGDFNFATLFLLPKKETNLIDDTRPISVNNSGNRLVARVLFMSVVDASQKLITDYQKMFLPGRLMTDHLRGLADSFYHNVQVQDDFHVLFTDNSKAFDSIHHDFILSTLNKQGFPCWFTNSISNLLTNVIVSPSIAPSAKITIGRGVKQGCPLSPLLFILCYDVLHFKLTSISNLKIRAAADDLALESNDIGTIIQSFPILDRFTDASGLGINRDKTVLLSSNDISSLDYSTITNKLKESTWPLVVTVESHKYLGILFGRNLQVDEVFAAPFKKALNRIKQLTPSLRRLDTQRRILVFNVFITPIISFVQQFYMMSSGMYREFRRLAHQLISPFGSSS